MSGPTYVSRVLIRCTKSRDTAYGVAPGLGWTAGSRVAHAATVDRPGFDRRPEDVWD
jgi:hypothetical protein